MVLFIIYRSYAEVWKYIDKDLEIYTKRKKDDRS